MPLSDYEIDWIEQVSKKPVDSDSLKKAAKLQLAREEFLQTGIIDVLAKKSQQIEDAQKIILKDSVEISGTEKLWLQVRRKDTTVIEETPWRAKDEDLGSGWKRRVDIEADTKEDVGADTLEIPAEQLAALNDALASILEMQQQMLLKYDADGNRMFSDDDIRRELWTPMVRTGLIPENMVPDKFSEEALAFKGAAEIYGDKIKDFSKQSTGKEDLLKKLKIGKEVVGLAGSIVTSTISMANAPTLAANTEAIRTGNAADGTPLSPDQIKDLKVQNSELANQQKLAVLASTVATGGLELTIAGVEASTRKKDEARWAALVDKTLGVMMSIIAKAVDPLNRIGAHEDIATASDAGKEKVNHAKMVSGALQAAITGIRFGPTLYQLAKAPDEKAKLSIISDLVGKVGDAVGYSMAAYGAQMSKTDANAGAAFSEIGAGVQAGIKAMGRAPLIYKALENGKSAEAAILLGGGAIQLAFSGSSESLFDAMRTDVSKDEFADASFASTAYLEKTGSAQEKKQDLGAAKMIADIEKQMGSIDKSLIGRIANAPPPDMDATQAAQLQKQIADDLDRKERIEADLVLSAHFTPEAVDAMFADFKDEMVGYEEMYAAANPQANLDGQPESDVEKALDSIDRAIANTAELRARVEILNCVTSATVGVVASFVPGAGAAVAAQKIAFDIYALVQTTDMHNKWCESMEISFRANSAYSSAIERTLTGARITLQRTKVKLVLDTLMLGAQVGRCFDPTGAASVVSSALTLTQSLVEFGYKMATVSEISSAWDAYKDALANPGNRKRARAALLGNSTLAKCAVAYGACMANDAVAKEAIRICGLSPEILADDKDVCKRLVSYLENELNQDPVILEVQKTARPWYPSARPILTPTSWFQYRAAAMKFAMPRLAPVSGSTPAIDNTLSALAAADCWAGKMSYAEARSAAARDPADPTAAIQALAKKTIPLLEQLDTAFSGYRPLALGQNGQADQAHSDMGGIVRTYSALISLNIKSARIDMADDGL